MSNIVEENQCGFYTNPHLPSDFVQKIEAFLVDKEKLMVAKKNARIAAEKHFDKEHWAELFLQEIEKIAR